MKKYFCIFFSCIVSSAFGNRIMNEVDSLGINPGSDSSITALKNNKQRLMGVTQQIVEGTYFLPTYEIAYGDGSGLTSSSNFTWNGTSLNLGNISSSSTSTPMYISFGGTYSSTPGQNLKLKLYDDGNSGNVFGLGISASQMDYTVAPASRHVWWTGTSERMRLNGDGKLLINTTDQGDYKLQVGGQILAPVISLGETSSATAGQNLKLKLYETNGTNVYGFGISAYQMDYAVPINSRHAWWIGSTEQMRINGDGNVGIGTTTPQVKLDVNGSIQGGEIISNNQFRISGNNPASWTGSGYYAIKPALDGVNNYPTLGSTGSISLVVFENPHVAYRTDNGRPGASGRSGVRMAANASASAWWDAGLKDGDEYEIYRFTNSSNSGSQFLSINSSGQFKIPNLSDGSGVPRMVVSTNGVLSYQNINGGAGGSLNQYQLAVGNSSNLLSGSNELTYNAGKLALQYGSNYENNVLQMGPGAYVQGRANHNSLLELSGGSFWNGSNSWSTNSSSTTASVLSLYNGEMWFHTNDGLAANSSFTPTLRMKLTTAGKLLLNTTDQGDYKLQVQGNSLNKDGTAYFMTSNPSTGPLQVIMPSSDPGAAHVVYRNPSGSHIAQSFVFGEGGNAVQKARIRAGNDGELVFESTGTQYFGYHGLAGNVNMRFGGATERMFINGSNGQVRIGSLATGNITKMVITDQNGLLSFQDIPSGSGTSGWALGGNAATPSDFIGTTNNQSLLFKANNTEGLRIIPSGQVGIATTAATSFSDASYKLFVEGGVRARKVKVDIDGWSDYVFYPSYKLPALKEVEAFIKQHKHLPDVPSEAAVKKEGIDVAETQALLLKKIEELTLYIIEQEKRIQKLEAQVTNK